MSFASFAHSSASPALLPLLNLLRCLFAPSFAPSNNDLSILAKKPLTQSPAFLRPTAIRLETRCQPTAKPDAYRKPCPQQGAVTLPTLSKTPKLPKPSCRQQLPALRVVRMLESGQSPRAVGRMVISGRMADVCAELDRLVGREQSIRGEVVH